MLNKIKKLLKFIDNINLEKKIIIFCESENLYKKVLKKELINLIQKNIIDQIVLVSFKNNMNYVEEKNILRINLKNEFFLKLFFRNLNNSIIISTTPTINKKLSNTTNKFFYTQHSLCLLSNEFLAKDFFNFDFICVNNFDQYLNAHELIKKSDKKVSIIKERYYELDELFSDNIDNKSEQTNTILIASSFYGNSIIENIDIGFLKKLSLDNHIIFRPHPESFKNLKHMKVIENIDNLKIKNLTVSKESSNKNDIKISNQLITDYSAIALTFAYYKKKKIINLLKNTSDIEILQKNINKETLKIISQISYYNYEEILNLIDLNKNSEFNSMQILINKQFKEFKKKVDYQSLFNLLILN